MIKRRGTAAVWRRGSSLPTAYGLAWLLLAAGCTSLARDVSRNDSTGSQWSSPVALADRVIGGEPYPDLAIMESGTWVSDFAVVRRRDGSPSRGERLTRLRIKTPDGSWIDPPAGTFTFAFARIATAPGGTLHLVWAEPVAGAPDSITAGPLQLWDYTSVWHSLLRRGQWSAPERVYRDTDINWDPVSTSRFTVGVGGELHLAFTAIDSTGRPGVVHLRLYDRQGSRNFIPVHGRPAYVEASVDSEGAITIVYALNHRDSAGWHTNTLFVTRSNDGGRSWTEPHPVTRPEQGPAYEPRLARGRGDTLHLVWTQSDAADQNATVALWHAASADGGTSWGTPVSYPISGMTHQLQAVAAPCGGLYVVYSDFSRQALVYARLFGDAAPLMQTPFTDIASNPVLRIDDDGTVHLVWTATTVTSPDGSAWHTRLLHSTLRAC